uniref:Uncharacterized protein n=1 Tax=Anopheles merus TaxID=30066 RepID=A0A182V6P5_ANOME
MAAATADAVGAVAGRDGPVAGLLLPVAPLPPAPPPPALTITSIVGTGAEERIYLPDELEPAAPAPLGKLVGWPGTEKVGRKVAKFAAAAAAKPGSVVPCQPRQDRTLRHLQPLGDGRDAGQRRRQPRHVRLHVRQQLLELVQHLVQYGVGGLVAGERLLAQMLMRFRQTLHLGEPGIQRHRRMGRILGEIEQGGPAQLLLDDERLLEQLEPAGQEFVLDLEEVALAHVHLERFVDDREPDVVLDVLPAAVPVRDDARQQPISYSRPGTAAFSSLIHSVCSSVKPPSAMLNMNARLCTSRFSCTGSGFFTSSSSSFTNTTSSSSSSIVVVVVVVVVVAGAGAGVGFVSGSWFFTTGGSVLPSSTNFTSSSSSSSSASFLASTGAFFASSALLFAAPSAGFFSSDFSFSSAASFFGTTAPASSSVLTLFRSIASSPDGCLSSFFSPSVSIGSSFAVTSPLLSSFFLSVASSAPSSFTSFFTSAAFSPSSAGVVPLPPSVGFSLSPPSVAFSPDCCSSSLSPDALAFGAGLGAALVAGVALVLVVADLDVSPLAGAAAPAVPDVPSPPGAAPTAAGAATAILTGSHGRLISSGML